MNTHLFHLCKTVKIEKCNRKVESFFHCTSLQSNVHYKPTHTAKWSKDVRTQQHNKNTVYHKYYKYLSMRELIRYNDLFLLGPF